MVTEATDLAAASRHGSQGCDMPDRLWRMDMPGCPSVIIILGFFLLVPRRPTAATLAIGKAVARPCSLFDDSENQRRGLSS